MRTQSKTNGKNAGNQDEIGFYFAYDWLRERGASFLDQSQSEVKENQLNAILDYFWNTIENCSEAKILLVVLCYGNRNNLPVKCWLYV